MAKSLSEIAREMRAEAEPLDMTILWRNVVDDFWHREYTSGCYVCKHAFCQYEKPEDL